MIDIEKEREAFEDSHNVHPDNTFYFHTELNQYIAINSEMEQIVDSFNEHWDTWLQCVEFKQVEIDNLGESRMNWREYAMKIESGEYELVKKAESEKCKWRKNLNGNYKSSCGAYFGSLAWYFCQKCGREIEDVGFEESEDE